MSEKEPIGTVTQRLRDNLGSRSVAYVLEFENTKAVQEIAEGSTICSPEQEERLRQLDQASTPIAESDGPQIAQSWVMGLKAETETGKGERSPLSMIRDGDGEDAISSLSNFYS